MKTLKFLCFLIAASFAQAQNLPSHACESARVGTANASLTHARIESEAGDVFLAQGEWNKAYLHKKRAYDAFRAAGTLLEVRRTALSLATVLFEQKQFVGASRYLDAARSVPISDDCLDNDDRAALSSVSSLEDHFAGASNAAVFHSRDALSYWLLAHGANHPFTGWGHLLLADAYANNGQSEEAMNEFRLAVATLGKSLPKSDKHYLTAVARYTRELRRNQDERKMKRALTALETRHDPE